jgi:2-haloacid dehalogenase
MNYDWILFDADHTLFDFDRSARHALTMTLDEIGVTAAEEHFSTYHRINAEAWRAFEDKRIDAQVLRRVRFERFFEAIGVEHEAPEQFNAAYLGKLPDLPFFMDGALDLLDRLRLKYALGLITNGLSEVQRPRLVKSGLIEYFQVVVVSGEIGYAKPEHAYFAYAHDDMGGPDKERVLVVGDNLNSDIRGGRDFGFQTCWYNPGGGQNTSDVHPDYEIAHLGEILSILGHDHA